MRNKHRRWLFVWANASLLLHILQCELAEANILLNSTRLENSTSSKEVRSVFSPRMDYEQWTPLGRGDPLKNDPTYDYVPPVLERVHYWVDPSLRKPDPPLPGEPSQKTEILVLGVSSKKPSNSIADSRRDSYDPFMKFVDGPKFPNYQRISHRPHFQSYSYYPFYKSKGFSNAVPYTVLVPPPVPTSRPEKNNSQTSVTIQESNLIYQSSTTSGKNEWIDDKYHTSADSSSLVTWRTPLPYHEYKLSKNNSENNTEIVMNSQISGPDIMFKGMVSDGDLDVDNTYVNIGKPEAQVHSGSAMGVEPPIMVQSIAPPFINKPITLQTMQTLQPQKPSSLSALLLSESTMANFIANIPKATTKIYTTPTPSTTTPSSLTTDPLFKHYKQPSEPLRGPMYLIIQGHSKVKTYGPTKQIHGINIQEFNEIPNDYRDEYQVKHLHTYKKKPEESPRAGRSNNLETLSQVVQTGFGAIEYANRRQDIKETELVAGFNVADDVTSEIYHKGIVEEENLSKQI